MCMLAVCATRARGAAGFSQQPCDVSRTVFRDSYVWERDERPPLHRYLGALHSAGSQDPPSPPGAKSVVPAIVLPGRKKSIRVATRGCPFRSGTVAKPWCAPHGQPSPSSAHAALKTYANASTELTNLEHFFDAHLSTGLPALLGARPPVDGDVDKALKGCAKTGLALDACPALLEVLSVPRYAAHDYVARAAGLRNASQESASPLFLYGGAKDDGCTQPAHSLYAVLKGTASATGAFGTAKLDDDAKALLFVPGNDDKLTFTVSKGAAVRFCVVDASNVRSVRRLAKESPDVPFPTPSPWSFLELLTALDDPEFDFVMARSYSGRWPGPSWRRASPASADHARRRDHDCRAGGRGPRPEEKPVHQQTKRQRKNFGSWQSEQHAGTGAS